MTIKVFIWLCAFACCLLLSLQEWAIDDTGCITPHKAVGDCVDIYECAPIVDLLKLHLKQRKVVSEHLKTVLGKYVCGIGKVTKVCCPRVVKIATTTKTPDVTPTPFIVNHGPIFSPDVRPAPVATPDVITTTIMTPDVTPTPVVSPTPTLTPLDVTRTPVVNPDVTPDTECITPKNVVGDCVNIYDCKSMRSLFALHLNRKNLVSERLKITLGKYVCGIGKDTKVCCPRVVNTTKNTKSIKSPKPISTPDVTPIPVTTLAPDVTPPLVVNPGPTLAPPDVTPEPILTPDLVMSDTTNPQISGRNLLPMDSCGFYDSENRVYGGERAKLFEFPWMALLAYETSTGIQYLCGGTLINDRYVLTAAHCLTNLSNQKLAYVRLGEYDLGNTTDCDTPPGGGDTVCADPAEDILAEKVIVHPEFDYASFRNDIGLIRLQNKIDRKRHQNQISPICLPLEPELRNATLRNVVLTGWGLIGANRRSDILMKVDVNMMDQAQCRKIYSRSNVEVTDNHRCAGGVGRKGSCPGDSGGPVQLIQVHNSEVKYVQHGVLSLGSSICGGLGFPGLHTRVDRYLDWIINTVRP